MSIKVMSAVWEHYPAGGSELLALLALADWSDDDGRCFPSVAAIAKKTRLSKSQAQRVVHNLISAGTVVVEGNEAGGPPGATRRYRVMVHRLTGSIHATPTGCTGATGSADATGRTHAADGSHPCSVTGSTHATQTVIEPSKNQEEVDKPPARLPSTKVTFRKWVEAVAESGEPAITEHAPTWNYAQRIGLSDELVALAWFAFKKRYTERESYRQKKYADWRVVFRNALEGNWLKLWYATAEGYGLTTTGIQVQREFESEGVVA